MKGTKTMWAAYVWLGDILVEEMQVTWTKNQYQVIGERRIVTGFKRTINKHNNKTLFDTRVEACKNLVVTHRERMWAARKTYDNVFTEYMKVLDFTCNSKEQ